MHNAQDYRVLYNNAVGMVICDDWYLHVHDGIMILVISLGEDKGNLYCNW